VGGFEPPFNEALALSRCFCIAAFEPSNSRVTPHPEASIMKSKGQAKCVHIFLNAQYYQPALRSSPSAPQDRWAEDRFAAASAGGSFLAPGPRLPAVMVVVVIVCSAHPIDEWALHSGTGPLCFWRGRRRAPAVERSIRRSWPRRRPVSTTSCHTESRAATTNSRAGFFDSASNDDRPSTTTNAIAITWMARFRRQWRHSTAVA